MIPGGNILINMDKSGDSLDAISNIQRGFEIGRNQVRQAGDYLFLTGSNVRRYTNESYTYITEDIYQDLQR